MIFLLVFFQLTVEFQTNDIPQKKVENFLSRGFCYLIILSVKNKLSLNFIRRNRLMKLKKIPS